MDNALSMDKRSKRLLAGAVGLAGLGWLGFIVTVTARQNNMLFNPIRRKEVDRPRSSKHRTRPVVLRCHDGTRLSGWLLTPRTPGPHAAAIYFGGRSEEVSWAVRDAQRMFPGMLVLAINYRGYGDSHGSPAERHMIDDGTMLYDWLLASGQHVDPGRIAIVGRSLGSSVALQVAARRTVAALVLITPFDSVLAMVKKRLPSVPVSLVLKHRFESIKVAPKVATPVLVLRAESDDIVPQVHTDILVAELPNVVSDAVVPGSNHLDIPYLDETQEHILQFMQGRLSGRPALTPKPQRQTAEEKLLSEIASVQLGPEVTEPGPGEESERERGSETHISGARI